jgi:hypothetical protein
MIGPFDYRLPNGMYHRANGPAMLHSNGYCGWYLFNTWHRYYGPRNNVECFWFIHGVQVK